MLGFIIGIGILQSLAIIGIYATYSKAVYIKDSPYYGDR